MHSRDSSPSLPARSGGLIIALALAAAVGPAVAQEKEPIKIGFSMALTGGLAAGGQGGVDRDGDLARRRQQERRAARPAGGAHLLRRRHAARQGARHLHQALEVDKVDLVVSGYGTNLIAPAMPIIMRKKLVFPALFGLAANEEFKLRPLLPDHAGRARAEDRLVEGLLSSSRSSRTRGRNTMAIVAADAEFSLERRRRRARERQEAGLPHRL